MSIDPVYSGSLEVSLARLPMLSIGMQARIVRKRVDGTPLSDCNAKMAEDRKRTAGRDPRSTRQIVEALLEEDDEERRWRLIPVLHARGSRTEYDAAIRLTRGEREAERVLGAQILGQLGWRDRTFLEESVSRLIDLLADSSPEVVADAAVALGHRKHRRAIAPLVVLQDHPDDGVRWAATFGLLGHEDSRAIASLIRLSSDEGPDIRNWATFGIGDMSDVDGPEVREALRARLLESDAEIRGEAIRGLARRKDPQSYELIARELEREEILILTLEAARALGDPRLFPELSQLRGEAEGEAPDYVVSCLDDALEACRPRRDEPRKA